MQKKVLPTSLKASALLLAVLGRPFPGLAARLFLRFYSTPPKRKFRSSHFAVRDQAVTSRFQLQQYPSGNAAISLAAYHWGQSDKKILLLHGWGGSPLDFRQMITALVGSGYEVIGFDAPAHGFSEGKRTNLVQWMYILQQVLQQVGPLHGVIGHSLGGLNAALTLVNQQEMVPRLVMISASVSAPAFFRETYEQFRIPPRVVEKVQALIKERLGQDLEQLDLHRHLHKIKASEILVVYDENDELVKPYDVSAFLQEYETITAYQIRGEGHFRIMRNEAVIGKVVEFLF